MHRRYMPWLMWLFPLSFFAYQFILRLWPALMMQPIMERFSIDATHFGLLAAFYYYGYAGMQIPVAMLLDRFGPRRVLFVFATLCAASTWLFNYTDHFYIAILSRFLIGAGSAVGFLAVSKVVSEWFPKEAYARMIGLSFSVGLMGAIYGGKPISLLIDTYHWQNVATVLALLSLVIGIMTYLIVRTPRQVVNAMPRESFTGRQIIGVLSSPIIWVLAFSNLLMVGALEGFADVWGVQYLMTAYGMSKGDAAGVTSFIFFGMLFGGPLLAACSKRVGHYAVIATCGIGIAVVFWCVLFAALDTRLLSPLFFLIGIMCCYQVIVFAAGSSLVLPQYLGVTIAFLNCINMLGGSFFHTTIGRLMDLSSHSIGKAAGDGYSLASYRYALSIIPISALLGAVLVALLAVHMKRRHHSAATVL